jgi:hypothetical protein
MSDSGHALVAEAATKSDLLWVRPNSGERAWPAWHVWHDGAAYVVSGPGEQDLPALVGEIEVILRSRDTYARLVTVRGTATTVPPEDPGWAGAATALKAKRLNAPDPEQMLNPAEPGRRAGRRTGPVRRRLPRGTAATDGGDHRALGALAPARPPVDPPGRAQGPPRLLTAPDSEVPTSGRASGCARSRRA